MRYTIKKGDIYRVVLEDNTVRFFQYLGKDISALNGDVIRIFKHHYDNNIVINTEEIVSDSVEGYMHTSVIVGLNQGLWQKYSSSSNLGSKDVLFRTSQDSGLYPFQHIVSHKWVVWKMNEERIFVGSLPSEYQGADLGGVYAPIHVVYRLATGKMPDKYYPDYE